MVKKFILEHEKIARSEIFVHESLYFQLQIYLECSF